MSTPESRPENRAETLKAEISSWFDARKAKVLKAIEHGMRERDMEDLLNTLKGIDGEHNEFDDFIPNSAVRKMLGVKESE